MDNNTPFISVVIPVHNEQDTLEELCSRIIAVMTTAEWDYEIIAVDDGSTDESLTILRQLHEKEPHIRVVCLSRNFGQSPALYAGISKAKGQYIVTIDADLQNFPEDIPSLIKKLEEGYDMVSGYRSRRQDSTFRKTMSRAMNWIVARITRLPLRDYGCSIKAIRRELAEHMLQLTHRCRYLPADIAHLGGAVCEVEVQHQERTKGESKYGILRLIKTAFDLLTSISIAPLQFISVVGWLLALVGFGMGIRVALIRLIYGNNLQLESVVAIFFFIAGAQMIAMGLTCEYIGRIYLEVQKKPYFIIKKELD